MERELQPGRLIRLAATNKTWKVASTNVGTQVDAGNTTFVGMQKVDLRYGPYIWLIAGSSLIRSEIRFA